MVRGKASEIPVVIKRGRGRPRKIVELPVGNGPAPPPPEVKVLPVAPPAPPKAVLGHNSQLSDDEERAQLFRHEREYRESLGAKKSADAQFKNTCKMIKTEGGKLADIKMLMELRNEKGLEELKKRQQRERRIAGWYTGRQGSQGDLFWATTPSPFEEGKTAGFEGQTAIPPTKYPPGTEHYNKWLEGHRAAQSILVQGIRPLSPIEDAVAKASRDDVRPTFLQRREQENAPPDFEEFGDTEPTYRA
jgi:hypothetical protein